MKTRTGGAVPIMNQYDTCQLVQKWFLVCWEGMKPDPKKVEAILDMPMPTDVEGVRRLIGTAQYLGKFVKGLTDLTGPCIYRFFLFRFQICERKTDNEFLFRFQICERRTKNEFLFRFSFSKVK